jgi:DNA repair protein RadA/Sms
MLLAVLHRRGGLRLTSSDVYVSTVGGARVIDPAADLAIAMAVASASLERNFPSRVIALGEVGLAGDLRVAEAARLGFTTAVVPTPPAGQALPSPKGIDVIGVPTLAQALAATDLRRLRPAR